MLSGRGAWDTGRSVFTQGVSGQFVVRGRGAWDKEVKLFRQ